MTAQAALPVTGSSWELLLKYSCTDVYQLSDFTILNQRLNSSDPGYVTDFNATFGNTGELGVNRDDVDYFYDFLDDVDKSLESINVLSQRRFIDITTWNINAWAELGLRPYFKSITLSYDYGY
jgi:hypothetical protein